MFRPTRAVVDLQKIKSNMATLRGLSGDGFFCPMVKANAYGHGDVEVANAIVRAGAERIGVAMVEEGLRLRKAGLARPEILVFGRLTKESAKAVIEFRLTPVLSSFADFDFLLNAEPEGPLALHIKFDTGMHRMGFSPTDVPRLREFFAHESRLRCVGMGTHLSQGDDAGELGGRSQKQILRFRQIFEEMREPKLLLHVLNSEGLLSRSQKPHTDAEWLGARPGLAVYGLCDTPLLEPAMHLATRLDLVRRVNKGESISYGGRWTASKESWIGIVPIGYGDGYFRAFSNKGVMLFRGARVPVVGTVCMDYSLIDLTSVCADGEPKVGEDVVVFGQQGNAEITVMELTQLIDTIPYELVTCLSARVPREYK